MAGNRHTAILLSTIVVVSATCSGSSGLDECGSVPETDANSLLQTIQRRESLEYSPYAYPGSQTEDPECGPDQDRATTPDLYKKCWEDGRFCCVSNNLAASVMPPNPTDDATIYPRARYFAWAGTSKDMETALKLRIKYGDFSSLVTLGIQVAVGFNPVFNSFGEDGAPPDDPGFAFLVLEKRKGGKGGTTPPTFAYFFDWVNEQFQSDGFSLGYHALKQILLTYANLGSNGAPYDVAQAWVNLTGCSRHCSVPVTGDVEISKECGCQEDVLEAWDATRSFNGSGDTIKCFKALFKKVKHPTAGQTRVAFHACSDMLPIFTGFGLGYNPLVNPLDCKGPYFSCKLPVSSRYDGPEIVFRNDPVQYLNESGTARYIDLAQVRQSDINKLDQSFC